MQAFKKTQKCERTELKASFRIKKVVSCNTRNIFFHFFKKTNMYS